MGRTSTTRVGVEKKPKVEMSDRAKALLQRIRRRREQIRRRVGILPDSAELIRQDRER
jgi:hypothetical protein